MPYVGLFVYNHIFSGNEDFEYLICCIELYPFGNKKRK
jgi:hypothetical protein